MDDREREQTIYEAARKRLEELDRFHAGLEDDVRTYARAMVEAERDESIRDAYLAGASLAACGRTHGLTLEGARRVLERLGVPRRKRGRPLADAPLRTPDTLKPYESGEPHREWTSRCGACLTLL